MKANIQLITAAVLSIGGLVLLRRISRNEKAVRGSMHVNGRDIAVARATTQYDSRPRRSNESSSCSRSPQELEILGDPINGIEIPTLENADYIIPVGNYPVLVTFSPRFKRMLPLIGNVPGRSGIRIHRGTKPEHSKGCILVSAAMEQQLTAEWLALQASNEPIKITIENEN